MSDPFFSKSKLTIEGGRALSGTVRSSGAKNAALPILAGCILLDGEIELDNVPHLMDVVTMVRMLNSLGLRAEMRDDNRVRIWNTKKVRHIAPYDLVTAMRASFFVAGPILAKTGLAKVPMPGGCAIGTRPIDIHLKGFKALGAEINIQHGFVELKSKKLKGANIRLDFPSVGATENLIMAASLAEGITVIDNAAHEPEIVDLAEFLIKAGAKISGVGTSTITIEGCDRLEGVSYTVIPDRVEIGTLMIAAAITQGDITIENAIPRHNEAVIEKMREAGLEINTGERFIRVKYVGKLNAVDVETQPFPGFPTDMQAQMMALLTVSDGHCVIKETIFENRFMHAHELMRMGADIRIEKNMALIKGVSTLSGAEVKITDLRAGAALVLAGLAAQGYTNIYGLKHLFRGYEKLDEKFRSLGARIAH